MKPVYCKRCGDEIATGYEINPVNSDLCEDCALKITENEEDDMIFGEEEYDDDLYDDAGDYNESSFED